MDVVSFEIASKRVSGTTARWEVRCGSGYRIFFGIATCNKRHNRVVEQSLAIPAEVEQESVSDVRTRMWLHS